MGFPFEYQMLWSGLGIFAHFRFGFQALLEILDGMFGIGIVNKVSGIQLANKKSEPSDDQIRFNHRLVQN